MNDVSQNFEARATRPCWQRKLPTLGIGTGLALTGFLVGTLLVGAVEAPGTSTAAMTPPAINVEQQVSLESRPQGFAEIVKSVRPAVVNITVSKVMTDWRPHDPFESRPDWFGPDFWGRDFFEKRKVPPSPRSPFEMGMGSGVIVSPDWYIVTNLHVVDGAKEVTVTLLDKREFTGKVIGADPQTDLAVVRVEAQDLPSVPWGDSSMLHVGDYVLAVGNPFGLNSTVTQGIVSALGRGGMGITQYEDFIQTDAAINPGNSGGALINMRGELVGINTAIMSRTGGYQGVGFAIPTKMGKPIYESLVKTGKVTRGFLGVGIQEVTPDLATSLQLQEATGALVTNVNDDSPAQRAGILRGDTIVKYQDVPVADPRALQRAVIKTPIATTVTLTIIRDGQEQEVMATIGEHPDTKRMARTQPSSDETSLAGVAVEKMNPRMAHRLGIDQDIHGVVVTSVKPGTHADQAGLVRGDVISEINRQAVHSVEAYEDAILKLQEDQPALLFIHRRGTPLFLTVKA